MSKITLAETRRRLCQYLRSLLIRVRRKHSYGCDLAEYKRIDFCEWGAGRRTRDPKRTDKHRPKKLKVQAFYPIRLLKAIQGRNRGWKGKNVGWGGEKKGTNTQNQQHIKDREASSFSWKKQSDRKQKKRSQKWESGSNFTTRENKCGCGKAERKELSRLGYQIWTCEIHI